jgi:hypothetical protein
VRRPWGVRGANYSGSQSLYNNAKNRRILTKYGTWWLVIQEALSTHFGYTLTQYALWTAVTVLGMAFGIVVFGYFADRVGRRPALFTFHAGARQWARLPKSSTKSFTRSARSARSIGSNTFWGFCRVLLATPENILAFSSVLAARRALNSWEPIRGCAHGNALGLEVFANFVVNLTQYGYDEAL